MSAKAYDKKTAAFGGWIIQNIPEDLTDADMNRWMGDPESTRNFLAGLKSREEIIEKPVALFSVAATTHLPAVAGKKTGKCFTDRRYAYRDSDFDDWLPVDQSNADACAIATLAPAWNWTFAEVAAKVLGVGAGTSIQMLGKALIENGHTMNLAQAEEMVEKTERGDKTGMHTDEYANFFFVETGNPKDPVSVGDVNRGERDWVAGVDRLGSDVRWCAGFRLLVRNLDTLKL